MVRVVEKLEPKSGCGDDSIVIMEKQEFELCIFLFKRKKN